MSYALQQRDPRRHLTGIVFVVLFHVLLAYGLLNGLAREVVKVLKDPLSVRLIEEVKPAPPPEPPPPPPPPPKKIIVKRAPVPPPPAYVPPPEVRVQAPVEPAPTISVVQSTPPEPAPAPVPAAPPEPVVAAIGVTCPNHVNIRSSVPYPPQALRLGKSGDVLVEFIVEADGGIGNVRIVKSTDSVFNKAVTSAVSRLKCVGQGRPVRVTVPFQFALDS